MGFPGFESALSRLGLAATPRELAARSAVLLLGLLVQTLRWERGRFTFYPPVFYLGGLMFGLVSPMAAAFSFVMVWAFSAALVQPAAFLTVQGIFVAGFSLFFPGNGLLVGSVAGSLCFLPVLLSVLGGRPLQLLSPRPSHPA